MVQFLPPSSLNVSYSPTGVIFNLGDFEGFLHRGNAAPLIKVLRTQADAIRPPAEGDVCLALLPRPNTESMGEFIWWEYPDAPRGSMSARIEVDGEVTTRVDFSPADLRELADKLDALSE